MDFCPICGDRPKFICKCPTASRICHNGHEWYLDMNKRYRLGNGHKEDGILYYGPIAEPLYEIVEYEDDRCPECGENAIHNLYPGGLLTCQNDHIFNSTIKHKFVKK